MCLFKDEKAWREKILAMDWCGILQWDTPELEEDEDIRG